MTKEELAGIIKRYVAKELASYSAPSIDLDEVATKAALLVPAGADGLDGQPGKDGSDGKDGKDGESVSEEAVKDAIAASFERRFSDLQLSWERQARETFEKAMDRMPAPKDGKDGRDSLPLESIEVLQEGRNVTLKLGDVERTIKLDTVIDRGVWAQQDYEKGDAVSYGGSLWIAQEDAPDGAPGTTKGWRLAVKKGRDGKDLRDSATARKESDPVSV